MCGKAHLLSVSASCGGQLSFDLAKPVICNDQLRAAREHWWVQPQETGKVVDRGWWSWKTREQFIKSVIELCFERLLIEGGCPDLSMR